MLDAIKGYNGYRVLMASRVSRQRSEAAVADGHHCH